MESGRWRATNGVLVLFERDVWFASTFMSLTLQVVLTDRWSLQKGVMISHKNVIANTLQMTTFEKSTRQALSSGAASPFTDVVLGLLPQNHIYALVVICHVGPYRGDQVITLPKFDLHLYLSSIQRFKIQALYVVSTPSYRKKRR